MGTTGQSITLANSIIGVGILAMPFCFQQCGVLLATLILLFMGLISRLCCYFLLKSALLARRRNFEFLGFNKRLVDDLLMECLEAMDQPPCKNEALTPFNRLKTNIQFLLNRAVTKDQMEMFQKENKSTEDILELLTDEKKKED